MDPLISAASVIVAGLSVGLASIGWIILASIDPTLVRALLRAKL
jgi:hypothetical protein